MECSICLCAIVSDTVTTVCRHTFHATCLQLWLGKTCPNCRHPLPSDEDTRRDAYEKFVRAQFPDGVMVGFAYDESNAAVWDITVHTGTRNWMSAEWRLYYQRAPLVAQRAYRMSNLGGVRTHINGCLRGAPPAKLDHCRYGDCLVTNDPILLDCHMRHHAIEEQLETFLSLML